MKKTVLPIGPFHPIQEEPECFQLHLDGERIVDMDVRIGYNHRGIEKLSESKTWHQIPFLVERICGICSASHPMAFVQAVEDIAGVKPPPRAMYLRTIVCELERIHSHLLWVGLAGHFIGYNTVFMWAWKYRDPCCDLLEELTGSRINYANARVGGVARDIPNEMLKKILPYLDVCEKALDLFAGAVADDPVLHARLKNVGVLSKEDARDYAVTGPTARGAGIPIDVRRDDPYAAYGELDWDVIVEDTGDVFNM
ncbi:MAG: hydrogenase large subunit, partial [Planctomycetota bacterium]